MAATSHDYSARTNAVCCGGKLITARCIRKPHIILYVNTAEWSLRASVHHAENTVPMSATSPSVLARSVIPMSEELFAGILAYKSAMAQARLMLSKGLITKDEYAIIDTMMAEKYSLSSCSLFRDNDLLYSSTAATACSRPSWYAATAAASSGRRC